MLLATTACVRHPVVLRPELAEAPPRNVPPVARQRSLLTLDRAALPKDWHAQLPAYDGDAFFVSLPAGAVAAGTIDTIVAGAVAPVLGVIRFPGSVAALAPPPRGVPMPAASTRGFARSLAFEQRTNRALVRRLTPRVMEAVTAHRPDRELDAPLLAARGRTSTQVVADMERRETQYVFRQVIDRVVVEHAGIIATSRDGKSITSVHGAVVAAYGDPSRRVIANRIALDPRAIAVRAARALAGITGIERVSPQPETGPDLVLLPYGDDARGRRMLRYAYRMTVPTVFRGHAGAMLVWADASDARILKLESLIQPFAGGPATPAVGTVFVRDPRGGTTLDTFEVDAAGNGAYVLKLETTGFSTRVDYQGDGQPGQYTADDVSVPGTGNGSSSTLANFDQAPIHDGAHALCKSGPSGGNAAFQQVNVFATLQRHHATVLAAGIFEKFPPRPFTPSVESTRCGSWSTLEFGVCQGYTDVACTALASADDTKNRINFGLDNTMVAHEFGHRATAQLAQARPADWCAPGALAPGDSCPMPQGWGDFHDFADFWAAQLESTNCIGGWVGQNAGGVGHSLDCAHHDEEGGLPRKLEPGVDHFPEHRRTARFDYADGQIAGAALWSARLGIRSRLGAIGVPEFGVAFQRALRNAGFLPGPLDTDDLGTYQRLQDLLRHLADYWATGSPGLAAAVNKVLAGFASAGLFLVPMDCLGPDAAQAPNCPDPVKGADAIIDVDDRDPANDASVNGVPHPITDFLEVGGQPPRFTVWTGPAYRLDGTDGVATMDAAPPCNPHFMVELSPQEDFSGAATIASGWLSVSVDATQAGACVGTWEPAANDWTALTSAGAGTKIYYRAATRDAAQTSVRVTTSPGNGLWTVPPSFVTLTATGQPDD